MTKRILLMASGLAAVSALVLGSGCATATGKSKGSAPGGGESREGERRRDSGRDTFSRSGADRSADVEHGRGTANHTGSGTIVQP